MMYYTNFFLFRHKLIRLTTGKIERIEHSMGEPPAEFIGYLIKENA